MKQLRERKGWTTWDLSVEADLKFDTVRGLETGEQRSRLHTIRKIAEALGTDPEGLFDLAQQLGSAAVERPQRFAELHRHEDLFKLLSERSRISAARIDELRAGTTLHVSLSRGLYVPRDVEDEIVQELLGAPDERRLAVVDGEPGTGKSSLLWHIRRRLDARDDCIAWLFDAIELPSVFAGGGSTPTVSAALRELVGDLLAGGQRVVVLVDTVDVAFNSTTPSAELLQFFTALNDLGVDVVVASRPLEARHFHLLSARVFHLFEYNDTELAQAINNYAAAFVGEVGLDQAQLHVEALLGAVAQGFPVREICRNPLTLRMLYTVYAPNQINVFDVNVVALYNEFWRRRVEKDVRHDFEPDSAEQDLSPAAMQIAIVMLVEGVPEVPRELLEQELAHAGVPASQLRGLESRGVVATATIGAQNLTSFFHQTFFEHAAAVAIVRLGGAAALDALYRRWLETDENPFIGAVFERTLVLAEHGVLAVRTQADDILDELAQAGSRAAAVLAYVFVHSRAVPEAVRQFVSDAVANEDPLLIERLLDVAANAAKSRQADLFDALAAIMNIESGRWVSRALSLLLRFWGGNTERIAQLLAESPKLPTILGGRYKVPEARDAYLAFLVSVALEEARRDWVLDQLVHLFGHADKIASDDFALGILSTLRAIAPHAPDFVTRFVEAAQIGARSGKLKALPVARELGGALQEGWKVSATPVSAVLDDLIAAPHRDLYLNARLFGLGFLLAASTPGEVRQIFREAGNVTDIALRVGLGRVTWATALPQIAEMWPEHEQEGVFADIRALVASGQNADVHAATVRHAWLEGRLSERLLAGLFDTRWTTPEFWADETLGGRRLVDAATERIEPAIAFLKVLTATPRRFPKLAPSVMQQIKFCMRPDPIELMGLGLAIEFGDPGVALALLQRRDAPPQWPADRSGQLRGLLDDLRRRRDVSSRRVHSELELELARLGLAPALHWEGFRARLSQDDDDVVRSRLIVAFGHLPDAAKDTVARVAWLIEFAAGAGLKTRTAVLELATSVTDRDPSLAPSITPMLMDVAFNGDTDGNLVALLQGPIYALYRTEDPRAGAIFKDLIARSGHLPTHSCLRISRVFRHLSSLIMRRLDDATRVELLESVPQINRYLGRLIVQGAVEAGTQSLLPRLKTIAENPAVGADVISMTRRYIRREMRTTGLGRWPELYALFTVVRVTSAP